MSKVGTKCSATKKSYARAPYKNHQNQGKIKDNGMLKKNQVYLFDDNVSMWEGLQKADTEKHVLLKASAIYKKGNIPEG